MKLYTVKSEGLAHNSYMIIEGEDAAVIDPRRDCQIYVRIAHRNCTKIRYIFETHRNEDYVVGSKELQNLSNAKICHSKELAFKYGDMKIDDGDVLNLGNLRFKALGTPGHTEESLCYLVIDSTKTSDPHMVFTGDTLFVGSIGRTDLLGKKQQALQARKLYASVRNKLLTLNDETLVYPAHGSGSVCGTEIGDESYSTIGYEKKTNPYLKIPEEAFVERCLAQELIVPDYFAKMEEYNLNGAPRLHGLPTPRPLDVSEFENAFRETDSVVVDTRLPNSFAGSHVSGSLNVWLGGGTSVYSGWLLSYDQRILLVVERRTDVKRALRHFWRVGFDNVYGFLCPGMSDWQEQGKPIGHINTLSCSELKEKLSSYSVIDVREPSEWQQEGSIEGSKQIFFTYLPKEASSLNRNKRYAVICSVGNRSSVASSILKQKGFDVTNVLGGMTAWKKLGFPTVRNQETSINEF